jgi:predicted small secreted protein
LEKLYERESMGANPDRPMKVMKKLLFLAVAAFALVTSFTGCRTAHGAGEDLENAGEKIQEKTN